MVGQLLAFGDLAVAAACEQHEQRRRHAPGMHVGRDVAPATYNAFRRAAELPRSYPAAKLRDSSKLPVPSPSKQKRMASTRCPRNAVQARAVAMQAQCGRHGA